MARVFLVASVKATWVGNHVSESPGTAEEMAQLVVRLLVEEMGAAKARRQLRRELAKYRSDYRGAGRDEGSPLLSD